MKNHNFNKLNIYKIGNFTKDAVETFEENIVSQHNYLEKVDKNLKNIKK